MGRALNALGSIAIDRGDVATARDLLDEAARHCREADDRWGLAWTFELLGVATYATGDYAGAAAIFAEALDRTRQFEDLNMLSEVLGDLAHVALVRGDLATAARSYERRYRTTARGALRGACPALPASRRRAINRALRRACMGRARRCTRTWVPPCVPASINASMGFWPLRGRR